MKKLRWIITIPLAMLAGFFALINRHVVDVILLPDDFLWRSEAVKTGEAVEGAAQSVQALILTIILGVYFTILQAYEYIEAPFTIAEAVYGSTFFVATGFHGLHVIIGSTFLIVCLYRITKFHFSSTHHFGFEAAA